jgi:hypothetical protein
MVKGHLPGFPFATAQGLVPCSLESSRSTKYLNNDDYKTSNTNNK